MKNGALSRELHVDGQGLKYVFGKHHTSKGKQECPLYKKIFKNLDYMEYDTKMQHFQNQRLQATQVSLSDFKFD
jgi:hypothetical protein